MKDSTDLLKLLLLGMIAIGMTLNVAGGVANWDLGGSGTTGDTDTSTGDTTDTTDSTDSTDSSQDSSWDNTCSPPCSEVCNCGVCRGGAGCACPEPGYDGRCSGGDPPSCFPPGTDVKMADGSMKDIEDVKVGDKVLSYDPLTDKYRNETVRKLESPVRDGYWSINNGHLNVTDEHPIWIKKPNNETGWGAINPDKSERDTGFQKVLQLEEGDKVFTKNGWKTVEILKYKPGELETYNLKSVTGSGTFFVENTLVHNKDNDPCGDQDPCSDGTCPPCNEDPCPNDACEGYCCPDDPHYCGDGSCDSDESCSSCPDDCGECNQPPNPDLQVGSSLVKAGGTVSLDASGSTDPDGDSLSYNWKLIYDKGSITPNGDTATYHAPGNVDGETVGWVFVNVSDGKVKEGTFETITVDGEKPSISTELINSSTGASIGKLTPDNYENVDLEAYAEDNDVVKDIEIKLVVGGTTGTVASCSSTSCKYDLSEAYSQTPDPEKQEDNLHFRILAEDEAGNQKNVETTVEVKNCDKRFLRDKDGDGHWSDKKTGCIATTDFNGEDNWYWDKKQPYGEINYKGAGKKASEPCVSPGNNCGERPGWWPPWSGQHPSNNGNQDKNNGGNECSTSADCPETCLKCQAGSCVPTPECNEEDNRPGEGADDHQYEGPTVGN